MISSNIIMDSPNTNELETKMDAKTLGNRIKSYEKIYTKEKIPQNQPLVIRLDGKNFSSYTKSLIKDKNPFSSGFSLIMSETGRYMHNTFGALVSYTVSDEITLIFINTGTSQHPFGGKLFKIQSLMSAAASVFFVSRLNESLPEKSGTLPIFDCRAFSVPDLDEAYNSVLWRYRDGRKNAVSAIARTFYSDKQLFKKVTKEQISMIEEKGGSIDSYDDIFIYGTCLIRIKKKISFTSEELMELPERHEARVKGTGEYYRNILVSVNMQELRKEFFKDINESNNSNVVV